MLCKPGARQDFEKIEASIAAVLQSQQFSEIALHLELIPGLVKLETSEPHVLRRLKNMPQNAVSIGVQNEQLGAGTLGGWVNFISTNDLSTQPMKCASTCYSVVAKGDPENHLHNDRNGMNLDRQPSSSHIGVMYPANIDAVLTRNYLQKEIQQSDDENGYKQRTLQLLDKFDAAGPMGHVRHAAGFRQNQDSRRID